MVGQVDRDHRRGDENQGRYQGAERTARQATNAMAAGTAIAYASPKPHQQTREGKNGKGGTGLAEGIGMESPKRHAAGKESQGKQPSPGNISLP